MLTDTEVWSLAKRMNIPLVFCDFKDQLLSHKLKYNKSYIINMENEFNEDGKRNDGSHYTCFQVNKYKNGKIEGVYFDSFGQPPPQVVKDFCKIDMPYQNKDIQSLMNGACGWYCLAFLHYINAFEQRTKDLYSDCEHFTDLFDDLNVEKNHLKNEYILKHFFRSADESKRIPISVGGDIVNPNTIITQDDDYSRK